MTVRQNCAAVILGLWFCANGYGTPVIFTYEGTGSGSIADQSFASAPFVILARGDTNDRVFLHGDSISTPHDFASISIENIGEFTFVTRTHTFANNSVEFRAVGFSRGLSFGLDLFNLPRLTLPQWDMLTSLGPLIDLGYLMQWDFEPVLTDGGLLRFDDGVSVATFTAIVAPEPAAIVIEAVTLAYFSVCRGIRARM